MSHIVSTPFFLYIDFIRKPKPIATIMITILLNCRIILIQMIEVYPVFKCVYSQMLTSSSQRVANSYRIICFSILDRQDYCSFGVTVNLLLWNYIFCVKLPPICQFVVPLIKLPPGLIVLYLLHCVKFLISY